MASFPPGVSSENGLQEFSSAEPDVFPLDLTADESLSPVREVVSSELRVLIVGSSASDRADLRLLLEAEPGVVVVDEREDGEVGAVIRKQNPDLIILDTPGEGAHYFGLGSRNLESDRPMIVVAPEPHYAMRAFELQAVDFLLRPLDKDRLHQAIERVRRTHPSRLVLQMVGLLQQPRLRSQPDQLVFRVNGRLVFLELSEIDWIGAAAKHVRLNAGTESHLVRESIGQLSKRLDPERFVRIHRSVIVNVQRIKELQPCNAGEYIAILKNGKRLPCSRGYRIELERYIARCVRTANTTR